MSRTMRRKNQTHEYDWILHELIHTGQWCRTSLRPSFSIIHIDQSSKEGRRRLAKYHSDNAGIPYNRVGHKRFCVRTTRRPDRYTAREQIRQWIRNGTDPEGDWNAYMSRTYRHNSFFIYWN